MAEILLKLSEDRHLKVRYPWVFNNQVKSIPNGLKAGDIVNVLNSKRKLMGKGFFSPHSAIMVRMLSFEDAEVNENFFYNRILSSIKRRHNLIEKTNALRLVYSEADELPTLVVDKYDDFIVIQTLGAGTDIRKGLFVDILCQILKPRGVYERNDVPVRAFEGLPSNKCLLRGSAPGLLTIKENNLRFLVDIENGQKTGFYLDQRDNRDILKDFSHNAEVLDCFCYTGGFSMYALHYGASHVMGIDASQESIMLARKNALLNNFANRNFEFKMANAFDELKQFDLAGKKFDVVILDPPSFIRKKEDLVSASRGYKEINLRAMKILKPGGILITCCCSYHISLEIFKNILISCASNVKRSVRILDIKNHPQDHPLLLQLKESYYLKCFLLQAV